MLSTSFRPGLAEALITLVCVFIAPLLACDGGPETAQESTSVTRPVPTVDSPGTLVQSASPPPLPSETPSRKTTTSSRSVSATSPAVAPTPASTQTQAPEPTPTPTPIPAFTPAPATTPSPTLAPTPKSTSTFKPTKPAEEPTPSPTNTPDPSPGERAAGYLSSSIPWFANPPDRWHESSAISLAQVWLVNPEMARLLSVTPWVTDGITSTESYRLEGVYEIAFTRPEFANYLLSYWLRHGLSGDCSTTFMP